MTSADLATVVREVRAAARQGRSFLDVVDLIHEQMVVPKYSRMPVVLVLRTAFGFSLMEALDLVSCDLFGKDGTTSLAESERLFMDKTRTG